MPLFLLKLLPFRWYAIGGLAAVVIAAFLAQSVRIRLWQHDYAEVKTALVRERGERAIEQAKTKDAVIKGLAERQALSDQLQQQKDAADAEHARFKTVEADLKKLADSYRTELGGLRGQLASAASGDRSASEDSVADCRRRADALADVLAQVVRLDAETESDLADAAEREAAGARALRAAWPR